MAGAADDGAGGPRGPASRPTAPTGALDWGPELPTRYAGARARVVVVGARLIRAVIDDASGAWSVELAGAVGQRLPRTHKDEGTWFEVPPGTSGAVRFLKHGPAGSRDVARIPFTTPSDGPADRAEERWARLGADGLEPAESPGGRPAEALDGPPAGGVYGRP